MSFRPAQILCDSCGGAAAWAAGMTKPLAWYYVDPPTHSSKHFCSWTCVKKWTGAPSPLGTFDATVTDAGGGEVLLVVDRDTVSYPEVGAKVRVAS